MMIISRLVIDVIVQHHPGGWGLIMTQVRRVVARLLGFKFTVKPKTRSKFDQGENLTFHPKETKETKTKGTVFFCSKTTTKSRGRRHWAAALKFDLCHPCATSPQRSVRTFMPLPW